MTDVNDSLFFQSAEFEAVAQTLRDKKPTLDADQQKMVYGLFKQGKLGDNSGDRPGMMSGLEAGQKWDAWEAQKGKTQDEAMAEYVEYVKPLIA